MSITPFDDNKNIQSTTLAEQQARQLLNRLAKARVLIASRVSIPEWTKTFTVLGSHQGEDRVQSVLDWYIAHYESGDVPNILSASAFAAFWRDIANLKDQDTSKVQATEDARIIYDALHRDLEWSAEADYCLLQLVQMSLDNYEPFRKAFREVTALVNLRDLDHRSSRPGQRREPEFTFYRNMWAFTDAHWTEYYIDRFDFVINWFAWLHGEINHRRNNLFWFVWRSDHPRWHQLFREWMYDFNGGCCWQDYLGVIVAYQKTEKLTPVEFGMTT